MFGNAFLLLVVAGQRLAQLEHFQLYVMHALLAVGDVLARFVDFFLLVGKLLVEHFHLLAQAFAALLGHRDAFGQRLDLALAFEQAVLALVRGKEGQAAARQQVAAAGNDDATGRQGFAQGQRLGQGLGAAHIAQPVGERAAHPRIVAAHACQQAVRRNRQRLSTAQHHRQATLGTVVQPLGKARRIVAGNRRQALAQYRFDRLFPTGLDMDFLPQRRGIFQAVALQPFRQLAAAGGLCLHLFKRGAARLAGSQFALQALQFAVHGFALAVELRNFLLQLLQMFLVAGQFLAQQFQFFFLLGHRHFIRRVAESLVAQPFAALDDGLQRALRMGLMGLLDFQLLLAIGRPRFQALQFLERLRMIFLDLRRQIHLCVQALFRFLDAQAGDFLCFFPGLAVAGQFFRRLRPMRQFVFQLYQPCFELAARFAPMADFRLQPGNFGIGRVHLALRIVQGVAGSEMGLAHFLGPRLGLAQGGALGFEFGRRPFDIERQALTLGLGFALLQQPQQLLFLHQLFVERVIAAGNFGLRCQTFDLVAEFLADILDPQQILAGIFQPTLSFLAPLLVAGNARRLFEKNAQIVRPRLDDARDHALADDRVSPRTQPGTEKKIGDVLAPDLLVVDEVIRLASPGQHPLDRQFRILRPLPERAAKKIVENQFDRSARHRLAIA